MTEREYNRLVEDMAPKSPIKKDCFNAFWIGGLICVIGQLFMNFYSYLGLDETNAGTAASMSLVAISAFRKGTFPYFSSNWGRKGEFSVA